ncbi:hypothetical protein [Mycobacterium simiae]|uniref:hypothetical protein n=1 Tax=Mycobacterium simiae TaxID=1784 RepID=UPI002604C1C7|nr:hypothetical protein [Mycobacterium simiae]
MTGEAAVIAARVASASEVFPLTRQDAFPSRVDVTAEGDALHVTVSERDGVIREYHARLVLVGSTSAVVDPP